MVIGTTWDGKAHTVRITGTPQVMPRVKEILFGEGVEVGEVMRAGTDPKQREARVSKHCKEWVMCRHSSRQACGMCVVTAGDNNRNIRRTGANGRGFELTL